MKFDGVYFQRGGIMLYENPLMAKVAENTLDRARQANLISYDEYRALGGRDIVPGLQKGNQALMRINNIRHTSSPEQMAEWVSQSELPPVNPKYKGMFTEQELRDSMSRGTSAYAKQRAAPGIGNPAFASPEANAIYTNFSSITPYGVPELVTRHEIDELRYGKEPKGLLQSFGHQDPRVITNEFRSSRRIENPVVNSLRSQDTPEGREYLRRSGGRFRYGINTSQVPDKKFWADINKSIADPNLPPARTDIFDKIRNVVDRYIPPTNYGGSKLPKDLWQDPAVSNVKSYNLGHDLLNPLHRQGSLAQVKAMSPLEVFSMRNSAGLDVLKSDPEFAAVINSKLKPMPLIKDTVRDAVDTFKRTFSKPKLLPSPGMGSATTQPAIKPPTVKLAPTIKPTALPAPMPAAPKPSGFASGIASGFKGIGRGIGRAIKSVTKVL